MIQVLTEISASEYVVATFAGWGSEYEGLVVTSVKVSPEYGAEVLDVSFSYSGGQKGIMSVWAQADGSLYGEW